MDANEQKARELLARAYDEGECPENAAYIRNGGGGECEFAIRAIMAAIAQQGAVAVDDAMVARFIEAATKQGFLHLRGTAVERSVHNVLTATLAQQVPAERLQDVTLGERLLALHARLDAKLGAGFIDDIPGDELSAICEAAAALRGDVSVEWVVNCSMGHGPNPHFDDKAKAVARWQEESAIPSYVRPGQLRKASITKVTTITQDCTPATPPSEG